MRDAPKFVLVVKIMKSNPEEPPRIAIKFANIIFILGVFYSTLIVVYALYKIYNPTGSVTPVFYIISIICGGMLVIFFSFGLKKLSSNFKVNLSILFFTTGITIYGLETYLELKTRKEIVAKIMGVPYDTRTLMEVVKELRVSGVDALPNTAPAFYKELNGFASKKGRIYPLGTISNKTVVYCNEIGFWLTYETDEHGFNNSKGLYKENKVDVTLIGDSFTEGACVKPNDTISAVLRQLNYNAISLGKGGNGSLLELAALKEYAEPLKAKNVLWLYYENDLITLQSEMNSSILRRYLIEKDYSQNLIFRQEEIDDVLINYIQNELEKEKKEREKERIELTDNAAIKIMKLYNLRMRINLLPKPKYEPLPTTTPTHIFKDILQKSNKMVSDWGGKMYFVYLPSFYRYSLGNERPNRNFVMQTATELDIPIIDIQSELFDTHPDPLSLFPFRMRGHYTVEGYKLVAEEIRKRLETDGYVPIKSKK